MKKIFTILLFTGISITSFAQFYESNDEFKKRNDVVFNERNDNMRRDNYRFTKREIEFRIAEINREYAYKIHDVKNNWFMSRGKKQRLINELECERTEEIRRVYMRFNNRDNHYHGPRNRW